MSRLAATRQQQQLSPKELQKLQEAIQLFDQSKYKSSLKATETLLATHPEHAESLAMEALCKAQFPSSQKGSIDIARHAIRNGMRSFLCWHALAICHRKNRQYAEALKAYSQASRLDPNNAMIVREVALMSTMIRNYAPIIDLRLTVLRMQPHFRLSWIQLALSHHLAGSLPEAIRVMEEYEAVVKDPPRSFDLSETWLYHATLLIEAERFSEAIDLLNLHADDVLDINARAELLGQSYQYLGKLPEAEQQYRLLLDRNPHALPYVQRYLLSKVIDSSGGCSQEKVLPLIEELELSWPESLAVRTTGLKLLSGPEFEKRAETHFVRACQKGVPSCFNSLKQFYEDTDKRSFIGAMAEKHRLVWQEAAVGEDNETESPSAYVWSLYFLAQHYSHLGDSSRAQAYIQSAIAHTPTLPELYMTQARIFKRVGSLQAAADAAETARLLDGQDRYLNCKSVKYALRIDDPETAVNLAGKFTMKTAANPAADLIDMQSFWFLTEEVSTYLRTGQYAMALKRLSQIQEIKDQLWNEQVDFHGYAARKFALRAYLDAVRWWDGTRSHPAAVKAELQLVDLCCKLHDHPELKQEEMAAAEAKAAAERQKKAEEEGAAPKLSTAQKKRLKAKQKAEASKKAETDNALEEMEAKQPDPDPTGIEAFKDVKPLELAQSTCELLQAYAADQVSTWLATFEWAVRAEKWLAAVRAAKQVERIDPSHPRLHLAKLRLAIEKPHISSGGKGVKVTFVEAIKSLTSSSPEAIHAEFIQKHPDSPEHTLAAAQGLLILAPAAKGGLSARKGEMVELLMSLPTQVKGRLEQESYSTPHAKPIDGGLGPYKCPMLLALTGGLELLHSPAVAAEAETINTFRTGTHEILPACDAFKDEALLAKEAAKRKLSREYWAPVADDAQNGAPRLRH